jgi:hypothetical protein
VALVVLELQQVYQFRLDLVLQSRLAEADPADPAAVIITMLQLVLILYLEALLRPVAGMARLGRAALTQEETVDQGAVVLTDILFLYLQQVEREQQDKETTAVAG